jgi:uncharacterized protein (TIRG00374 family)
LNNLFRKLILALLLGFLVVLGVAFLSDYRAVAGALAGFDIRYLPVILVLTFLNYLLRFFKWQYLLRQIDVEIAWKESFGIFLSGMAMSMTPGKVGELLKSLLLKELRGVPVSRTAPVIFAERLSDGFAMLILALAGMGVFRYGRQMLAVTAGLMLVVLLAVLLAVRYPAVARRLITLAAKFPLLNKFEQALHRLFDSTLRVVRPRSLAYCVLIGTVSWFFESIAFYYVFTGLGYQLSLLAATFTLAFSTVIGAVSMLPGGLGAAEGSIMGILLFMGVPGSIAGGATIIIRFCTLWFGVLLGLAALVRYRGIAGSFAKNEGSQKDEADEFRPGS